MTRISNSNSNTIKFLYSYGGKILPRRTDGKLRYVGGHTRVLSVDRSITFSELMIKFGELCGSSMKLKCKLPSEDLDVLISIANDDDVTNIIEEYKRYSESTQKDTKITAILFSPKSLKKITPVSSAEDLCSTGSSAKSSTVASPSYVAQHGPCLGQIRMYRRNQYGCRGGVGARNTPFVPSSNYCR